jgi:hypothetical protein
MRALNCGWAGEVLVVVSVNELPQPVKKRAALNNVSKV